MTADSIKDNLSEVLNRLVGQTVEKKMTAIQRSATQLQGQFFKYLAVSSGIIGAAHSPFLVGISLAQPQFRDLTGEYQARKGEGAKFSLLTGGKRLGGTGLAFKPSSAQDFFVNTGALKRYFATGAGDPTNKFGKPIVTYTQLGQNGYTRELATMKTKDAVKITGTFTAKGNPSNAKFIPLKTRFGSISVDLFPKIATLGGNFATADFFPLKVAYKLDNAYRGGNRSGGHSDRSRQFMNQYIQWWLRVKGAQMLKGAIQ